VKQESLIVKSGISGLQAGEDVNHKDPLSSQRITAQGHRLIQGFQLTGYRLLLFLLLRGHSGIDRG